MSALVARQPIFNGRADVVKLDVLTVNPASLVGRTARRRWTCDLLAACGPQESGEDGARLRVALRTSGRRG